MRIGETARRVGIEATAIRFYEQEGVLPAPHRTQAGYRVYTDQDVDLIRFVKQAWALGIPVDDVRQIVALRSRGDAPCQVVRSVIAREAAAIEHRISDLQDVQHELLRLQERAEDMSDDWPDGACVCHILESAADQPA